MSTAIDARPRQHAVRTQRRGDVLTATLDRPQRANAVSVELTEQLIDVVDQARDDDGVRALAIRSGGKHFCAGFDMERVLDQSEGDLLLRFVRVEQLLQRIRSAPFLTVACVAGKAVGAGADIAAACTHRFVDPGATLRFPGFRFGVALGTRHLATVIGTAAARDLLLESREVDAATALRIGLATAVVEKGRFDAAIDSAVRAAEGLDGPSVAAVLDRTDSARADAEDMAALVASLTRPGLHARLARYLGVDDA